MNSINLYGRIVRDVEIKTVGNSNTQRADFTIAVVRPFKNNDGNYESDFIPCSTFNETLIKILPKFVSKGSRLAVEGNLRVNSWQDKGEWKNFTYVNVNSVHFVETKQEQNNIDNGNVNKVVENYYGNKEEKQEKKQEVKTDPIDELPF